MNTYLSFKIFLHGEPGDYSAWAAAPDGGTTEPERCNWTSDDTTEALLDRLRAGGGSTAEDIIALGAKLRDAVFTPNIRRCHGEWCRKAGSKGLRIQLVVRPPELMILPWELLCEPNTENHLAASRVSPVVRYLETGGMVEPGQLNGPLKLLYVTANPKNTQEDTPKLDIDGNRRIIERSLEQAEKSDQIELTILEDTTPDMLLDALNDGYHVFHFYGYGQFKSGDSPEGILLLQDDEGDGSPFPGDLLAQFVEGTQLRLVVLNACESAMASPNDPVTGVAQQLIWNGRLPAVVAMQFEILQDCAQAFNQGLYGALAAQKQIEEAVTIGRKAMMTMLKPDHRHNHEWATPVLFMQTEDGNLWHPPDLWLAQLAEWKVQHRGSQALLRGVYTVHNTLGKGLGKKRPRSRGEWITRAGDKWQELCVRKLKNFAYELKSLQYVFQPEHMEVVAMAQNSDEISRNLMAVDVMDEEALNSLKGEISQLKGLLWDLLEAADREIERLVTYGLRTENEE